MLEYPVNCITPTQRIEYAYRCQELLRLTHNLMGEWYREGITENKWDKLPEKLKIRYPYQPQLSSEKWQDFKSGVFEIATNRIVTDMSKQKELLKKSTTWAINELDII